MKKTIGIALFLVSVLLADASVRLPRVFSDHMVLQRDVPLRVWGWGDPGERVEIAFAGEAVAATVSDTGRWSVKLRPLPASGEPRDLRIAGIDPTGRRQEQTLRDVLVGEVWFASGQSNMEVPLRDARDGEQEAAAAQYPQIRLFRAAATIAWLPRDDVAAGEWRACVPSVAPSLSAVAYFFARDLHRRLGVPIGIVQSNWGNTPAEAWMSRETLLALPETREAVGQWLAEVRARPDFVARFDEYHREWIRDVSQRSPERPPARAFSKQAPTGAYNAMIAPLLPLRFRGVIWYQGETNGNNDPRPYGSIFRALIRSWRETAGQGDFPFLFVQLANHHARRPEPVDEPWAALREGQSQALAEPSTAMVVAIDLGGDGIHPKNKQDVGARLARAARAVAYGEAIEYSGPLYDGCVITDGAIRVRFRHAGGLRARGTGPLQGFAVAGADRKFSWAEATIEGETVLVRSAHVPAPLAVRYAFADNPVATLENGAGLPASPFRSDDWPLRAPAQAAKL